MRGGDYFEVRAQFVSCDTRCVIFLYFHSYRLFSRVLCMSGSPPPPTLHLPLSTPPATMTNTNADASGGYIRKISAQAETDEKPLGRVKDMQRFLMDFERKNKEDNQRHVYQKREGPRPWEVKKAAAAVEKKVEEKEDEVVEEKKEEEAKEPVVEEEEEEEEEEDVEEEASTLDDFGKSLCSMTVTYALVGVSFTYSSNATSLSFVV